MNDVFLALSDPTRREILRLLKTADMTAGALAERFPLARSTLSGHFRVLKHAGLIVAEKNGTSIVYSLNLSAAEQALASLLTLFDSEQALAAVRNLLDAGKPPKVRAKSTARSKA